MLSITLRPDFYVKHHLTLGILGKASLGFGKFMLSIIGVGNFMLIINWRWEFYVKHHLALGILC
jgi:hypothetical protein